ncbi:hypothetical protein [uncultured Caulobacter sp.]|uniref:hypothetical protein n=1 Tax=uncultured Caulobacter sp. TaxID=158749 RepID=UPI00261FE6B7|nr:hypothetical protein [uncultured Caulobacter sp.]
MLTVLSVFDNPFIRLLAEILAVALVPAFVFLTLRLLDAEARLGRARSQAAELTTDRDRILAELALSRERLAEARQAAGRAQAEAAEREIRLKALLVQDRAVGETRSILASPRNPGH